ncbi:hypothetical protein ACHAXA_011245, partial [Cyclostephanos tholiformis]
ETKGGRNETDFSNNHKKRSHSEPLTKSVIGSSVIFSSTARGKIKIKVTAEGPEIMFCHGRGRTRAPLSSVDSNLVRTDSLGKPLTSREVNEDYKKGNMISMTKKRRPKSRRTHEIYTPLVVNDSTNSKRSNDAVDPTRIRPLNPSSRLTEESRSSHKSGGETNLAKTKIQPKKSMTTFHARNNITYDSQCWEDRQCAIFTTWLNNIFHHESYCNRVDDEQITLEWKAARQLFDSPKMRAIRCSVEREVKHGRLSINPRSDDGHLAVTPGIDRNILDEVHVREQLIKLLLSYSPRWLKLGLGTVFAMDDSEILKTNKQTSCFMSKGSLHKLILERVLTKPSQVRKYTSGGCKTLSWKCECKMRIANHQHALSQIMILIYFLDCAKRNRVLTEDPCLFEKSSRMKSSEEMLISLCQDCFSMQGSTIKHLDYEGISAFHVQHPLDEYDFHVKNLAADLKDGVCLAKLIEMVTNTPNILSLLRLPATTRDHKIYNVNIVLATLRQLGVPNISDITTAHIVAAHQPRILQLLWSTIIFFDLPHFRFEIVQYKASRLIQSHVRRFLETRSFQIARHGIISFQSAYRGFVARTTTRCITYASILIQKTWRGHQANLAYTFNLMSIITIQRFCRRCIARNRLNMMTGRIHSAAIRIQKSWRGHCCMIGFGRHVMCIITIQKICRRFIAKNRCRTIRKINAAVNIQRVWRGYYYRKMNVKSICRDDVALNRAMRQSNSTEIASINIQRVWRGYIAKLLYGFKLLDIITVQSISRRFNARKLISRKNACLLKIQSFIRMWVARKCYSNQRRHLQRALASSQKTHVVHIQRVIRGYLCRNQLASKMSAIQASLMILKPIEKMKDSNGNEKNLVLEKLSAGITSISEIKNDFITCNASESYCSLKCSSHNDADEISFTYRHASMKRDFVTGRKIARLVQKTDQVENVNNSNDDTRISIGKRITSQSTAPQIYLTEILQKKHSSSVHHQSSQSKTATAIAEVRLTPAQSNKREKSVKVIQKMYRGFAARERWMLTEFAAAIIQSAVRRHLCVTNYRYLCMSVILIQALFRGKKARLESKQKRLNSLPRSESLAATQIQKVWRGYVTNVHFIILILATIKIQSLARRRIAATKLLTIKCAALFNTNTAAAMLIQKMYRGFKARERFILTKFAAVIIQSAYRGRLGATSFHSLRKSAILTQALYRGGKIRQIASVKKKNYQIPRTQFHAPAAKVVLQQNIVDADMPRQPSESFAATQIQRVWRGYMANTNFILLILATIKVQSFAKKHIASTKYRNLRTGVVYAQAKFRGTKARRYAYIRRQAATMLQGVVRRFLIKLKRARILTAVSTLQRFSRGVIIRTRLHVEDLAATEIQRSWRGYRASVNFMLTVVSAIKIQSFIRSVLAEAKSRLQKEKSAAETRIRILVEQRKNQLIEAQHTDFAISKASLKCRGESVFSRAFQFPYTEAESYKRRYITTSHEVGQLPVKVPLTASDASGKESASETRHTAEAIRTIQMNKKFYEVLKAVMVMEKITSQSIENCRVIVNADAHQELISILCSCNRSPPHIELIRLILSLLTNLSQHHDLLSKLASDKTITTLIDLVHMFRDKLSILLLSSSLLEIMLRSSNHLVPKYSTPENKNRLRGIISLCKGKVSGLNDQHCIHCLENVIYMCENHLHTSMSVGDS